MIELNIKAYNKLAEYKQHFRTAVYGLCYSGLTSNQLLDIYEVVKPLGISYKPNVSCNNCRLKFLQEVGRAWFAFDEKVTKQRLESLEKARRVKAEKREEENNV